MNNMKDCSGRIIHIDDKVASNEAGYTFSLSIFTVVGFTKKMVKCSKNGDIVYKFPAQLCRIDYTPEDWVQF